MYWLLMYLLVGLVIVIFCFSVAARIDPESKWIVFVVGLALLPAWLTIAIALVGVIVIQLIAEDRRRRNFLKGRIKT